MLITTKTDLTSTLPASEFNQFLSELITNLIGTSGQTASAGDLDQIAKTVAAYAAQGGVFCVDSGAADAYTLAVVSPFKSPPVLKNGLTIKFRPGNSNLTTAPVVSVFGSSNVAIKKSDGVSSIGIGDLSSSEDVELRYDSVNTCFTFSPSATNAAKLRTISNKNIIINGDFNIWQRGTSFSSIADSAFFADRFRYQKSGTMVHDITRSTDVPTVAQAGRLFSYSALVDCTTADATIAAGDYCWVSQSVEGFNFQPIAQKAFTISFWVKGTKTGIHCVAFSNSGVDRSYVAEYTINTIDTWEYKTVTVTASPSAGTWDYTDGVGLKAYFVLAGGSTRQTTANAWQTGDYVATSSQVNACDSTSNNFRVCGVQIEAGSIATAFEKISIAKSFTDCYRYAQSFGGDGSFDLVGLGLAPSTTIADIAVRLATPMRGIPTLTYSGLWQISDSANVTPFVSMAILTASKTIVNIAVTVASGLTQFRAYRLEAADSSAARVLLSSEI